MRESAKEAKQLHKRRLRAPAEGFPTDLRTLALERNWAPKGKTPVLKSDFNWHQLSIIAGITFRRFLLPNSLRADRTQ
jgi:hypothetical protein